MSAYGSVDELNSFIGLARSFIESDKLKELDKILATIQNDLFDLGADLCIPDKDKNADSLKIVNSYVKNLEKEIPLSLKNSIPYKIRRYRVIRRTFNKVKSGTLLRIMIWNAKNKPIVDEAYPIM